MTASILVPSLWDDAKAKGLDEPGLLLYRSNLLGADLRITNFGGGNTSAKVMMTDPLTGAPVKVLWVKGSGGDLGSMKRDGFATLYLDKLESLKGLYRSLDQEDEMVHKLNHCTFNLNPRAASIDTCLHGYVPRPHVDHVHSDAVIAIAASADSERLTAEIFGAEIGYLPWQRPGIDLGIKLGRMAEQHPEYVGVVLGSHGLFTWGPDAKSCYETTLRIINKAAGWLETRRRKPAFGGAAVPPLGEAERRAVALRLMPEIRGRISKTEMKSGHFTDAPEVLEFVNSKALGELAPLGTSCPDHFLRTKIRPLIVPEDATGAALDQLLEDYRAGYAAYYQRCRHANSPAMRDANAVIYLVPEVGMIAFAKDKATARIASEFYVNAINVMRGASGVSAYTGLPEQEAFNIEYWLLEEAKLRRMAKPKSLAGRVALITGGAGGIGSAIASKFLSEGAAVVLADIDQTSLDEVVAGFDAAGDESGGARVRVLRQISLLHHAILRTEEQERFFFFLGEAAHRQDGDDLLALVELHEVHDGATAGLAAGLGHLVHLQPEDATAIGKGQQIGVRRCDESVLDEVFIFGLRRTLALAAALLRPIGGDR